MGWRAFTTLCVLLTPFGFGADTRFGRQILEPDDRDAYASSKIDEFAAPAIRQERVEVRCLAYRDASRLFLELEIRNRTGKDIEVGSDFVTVEQAGRKLTRTRTSAVAKEVETEALRPFVPKARDRESIEAEARRHLEAQELGVAFASLLQTFAQESGPASIGTGEDHTLACTFEAPKNDRDLLGILIKIGDQDFRFRFNPSSR